VKNHPPAHRPFGALSAFGCLVMSSCAWLFPARPAPPEVQFDHETHQDWGDDGPNCFYRFSERVKDATALPAFLALQDEKCRRADGAACLDRARAHLGGVRRCGECKRTRSCVAPAGLRSWAA
jgi:hypothetical protein